MDISQVDWTKYESVYGVSMNSAIVLPAEGSTAAVESGHVTLEGYAYPDGEKAC